MLDGGDPATGHDTVSWAAPTGSEAIDDLLVALAPGTAAVAAAWRAELRDFELGLSDGGRLLFRDCLQVSFHRRPSAGPPWVIGSWWTDEPSPVLLSLEPQVRFVYRHVVLELGEGLLRLAYRRVEKLGPGAADGSL